VLDVIILGAAIMVLLESVSALRRNLLEIRAAE
jgi:hypothetical protein